jgi:hypothetical protein
MRYIAGCVAAGVLVVAAAGTSLYGQAQGAQRGSGQAATAAPGSDPFNGTWTISRERSKQFTGDVLEPPGFEVITIKVGSDNIQHYTVTIQNPGQQARTSLTYDAKYNDGQWHPMGDGQVTMVKVDDMTQYRITRDAKGQSTGVMMRRMADDRKSYASTHMDTQGRLTYVRVFERQK